MPNTLVTTIPNSIEALKNFTESFSAFLSRENMPNTLRQKIELITEEILTNIVTHGYPIPQSDKIEFELNILPGKIKLSFKDLGVPFDPCKHPLPQLNIPLEERPIGGMGIHMVKTIASQISHEHTNNSNTLRIEIET